MFVKCRITNSRILQCICEKFIITMINIFVGDIILGMRRQYFIQFYIVKINGSQIFTVFVIFSQFNAFYSLLVTE